MSIPPSSAPRSSSATASTPTWSTSTPRPVFPTYDVHIRWPRRAENHRRRMADELVEILLDYVSGRNRRDDPGRPTSARSGPASRMTLQPAQPVVAIDLGGTKALVGVVEANGAVRSRVW